MSRTILHGKTLVLTFLLISLFLGIGSIDRVDAQGTTGVYLDPPQIFDTTLVPGTTFSVNMTIENVTDLYYWEIELDFNWNFLNTTLDTIDEGPFLKTGGTTTFEIVIFTWGVILSCTLNPPATSGVDGNGTLATVTFLVKQRGYTELYFGSIYLEDSLGVEIPPTPDSYSDYGFRNTENLFIEPLITVRNPGDSFAVNVKIANVTKVYGWQFTLNWKAGLITFVSATEGPFLKAGGSTFFPTPSSTASSVMVGCTLTGAVPGVSGGGTLATVNLKVAQNTGNCTLELYPTKLEGVILTPPPPTIYKINHTTEDGYFYTTRPVAEFAWTPINPSKSETIRFNATASYDPDQPYKNQTGIGIVSYHWDFGDGTSVTETDPFINHTYSEIAAYTVKLNVTDDDNEWWETPKSLVTVRRDVAVIDITASHLMAMPGTIVQVNATVINNGEIGEDINVTAYYDTNVIGKQNVTNLGATKNQTLTFDWNTTGIPLGVYTLKAVADIVSPYETNTTNNEFINGNITIETFNVILEEVPIGGVTFTYVITSNSPVINVFPFNQAGKEISFNVTGSEGTVGFCNVTIPMRLLNATPPEAWLVKFDGANISHTLLTNGTHSFIYFTYSHTSHKIQIIGTYAATAPIASFTTKLSVYTNEIVTFNATASYDPDGTIVSYYWDFGDGTNVTETDPVTTHIYTWGGRFYTVRLTVTDDQELKSGTSEDVYVSWFTNVTVLGVIASPNTVKYGEEVSITVTVKNDIKSDFAQTFSVIVYYGNETIQDKRIDEQTVTNLEPGTSTTLDFVWNTTGVAVDTYTIKAVADVVGESAPTDNTLVDGQVTIERLSSSVSISASLTQITIGESTIISGSITPPVEGAKVHIEYRMEGQETWERLAAAETDSEGQYLYIWKTTSLGTYEVYATRLIDETTEESESSIITITVNKIASTISIQLSQVSIDLGGTVIVDGSISVPGGVRAGVNVTVQFRLNEEDWTTIETLETNIQGSYAVFWTPSKAGTYELKASWPGDETTLAAESSIETITVEAPPSSDLLVPAAVIIGTAVAAGIAYKVIKDKSKK